MKAEGWRPVADSHHLNGKSAFLGESQNEFVTMLHGIPVDI